MIEVRVRPTTEHEYLHSPTGTYVTGRTWISFCPNDRLAGVVLWGRPDDEDVRSLLRTTPLQGPSPLAVRKARLVDVRDLDVPSPSVFAALQSYLMVHREVADAAVSRFALIRGPGMVGALVIGFWQLLPMRFPLEVFTDPVAAFDWMDLRDELPVLEEVERLQAEALGGTQIVSDLRASLEVHLAGATLGTVARRLGLSTRSLQRRLREAGTSFQRELGSARVRAAQRMLADTHASVADVAWHVGYSSVHQFASAFRKQTGASPRQWRADRRGEGRGAS